MSQSVFATDQSSARLAVFSACLLILVALIDSQFVAAIAPQIASGLHVAKTSVAGSVSVYAVAAAATALMLGRYARRMSPLTWLPVASLIFSAANLIAALAPHLAVFWAARSLAGLAGGLISALAIAALANASAYERRGRQMSGVAISYFLAPVLGVPLGTFLTGRFGWRVVFGASAVLVALAGLLVRQFPLPASDEATTHDQVSAATTRETGRAHANHSSSASLSLWQLATRSRSTRMGIVSAFFVSGGLVGLTAYLGTWLSDAFHAGTGDVGYIYAVAGVGAVGGGALGGMFADRFGKRRVAIDSSLGFVALVMLLPAFSWSAKLWILIGLTAFLAALRVAPLQALITELVAPTERAAYVALRNGASQLGIAAAVGMGGRLYASSGLTGVSLLCATLTVGAWLSMRRLDDPQETRMAVARDELAPPIKRQRVVRKLALVVLALALFIVAGLPWLLSFALTKAGTRPDEIKRRDTPAQQGASFENVTFNSSDGNQLSGWYLPARTHLVTIIMTHGLFRSRYEMLDRGVALWRMGYGVLLYDLRRHGQSAAEFSTIGYDERHDVEAALRFVRARAPQDRLALMGVSMGAAATLLAAAETHDEDVIAVIAESSFLSFSDTARHHISLVGLPAFPFADLLIKFTAWRLNFAPSDFDLLAAARKIPQPILFIGGGSDVRMPNETVLEPLYAAASNPLKRKLIVAGAKHGHAYDTAPEQYLAAIDEFLQAVEPPPRASQ